MSKGWYVTVETNVLFRVDTKIGVVASTSDQAMDEASKIISDELKKNGLCSADIPWEVEIGGLEWNRSGDPYFDEGFVEAVWAQPDSDFDPDEADQRDLMEAAMCLLEAFWNLKEDDPRKSDVYPNHGIAVIRDRMSTAANLCHQTWSVMVQLDDYDDCFDWDFCPRFLDNCMDDQMVLKSGKVHELRNMWKGDA